LNKASERINGRGPLFAKVVHMRISAAPLSSSVSIPRNKGLMPNFLVVMHFAARAPRLICTRAAMGKTIRAEVGRPPVPLHALARVDATPHKRKQGWNNQ